MVKVDGVFGYMFGAGDGRLPISGGGDQLLDGPFDIPSVFAEIVGKPIDQVRMGGPVPLRAEIAWSVG